MKAGRKFRFGTGWRSFAGADVRGTRPFAKNAKERGTHGVGDASEIKSLGHPPLLSTGSPTVTESYRAAPFQGWSVSLPPRAQHGKKPQPRYRTTGARKRHPSPCRN